MRNLTSTIRLRSRIPDALIVVLLIITQGIGLIPLVSLNVFSYVRFITLFFFFVYFFPKMKKVPFYKGMLAMVVFIMISSIYSHTVYHQNLVQLVVNGCWPFYGLLSFYILYYYRINIKNTRKIIKWMCILVTLFYYVQWLAYPREIFVWILDEFSVNDLRFRPRTWYALCCYCLVFIGVEESVTKKKYLSLLYSIYGAIPCFIMGFRSLMALTVISIILLILQASKASSYFKYGIIFGILSFVAFQLPIVQDKIDEMEKRQNIDNFSNKDYVRYLALDYYLNDLHKNTYEDVMGSGLPLMSAEKSISNNNYQNRFYNAYSLHLFWNDLGLIGLALLIGIPAVVLMLYFAFWIIKNANCKGLYFARYTMVVSVFGSIITTQEFYRMGNLIFTGFLLYYVYLVKKESA